MNRFPVFVSIFFISIPHSRFCWFIYLLSLITLYLSKITLSSILCYL
nr:MAG TPA: hypothetical protein [Caudoviricetes sp.]